MIFFVMFHLVFGWQVQGGMHQNIQVTAPMFRYVQPATLDVLQGDSEMSDSDASDSLQPALGYGAL